MVERLENRQRNIDSFIECDTTLNMKFFFFFRTERIIELKTKRTKFLFKIIFFFRHKHEFVLRIFQTFYWLFHFVTEDIFWFNLHLLTHNNFNFGIGWIKLTFQRLFHLREQLEVWGGWLLVKQCVQQLSFSQFAMFLYWNTVLCCHNVNK